MIHAATLAVEPDGGKGFDNKLQSTTMIPIPSSLRADMAKDPYYKRCARQDMFHDHECEVRPYDSQLIEWEHAFVVAGKRLQERWAIIPICWATHSGPQLDKEKNEYIALCRATLPE